MASTQDESRGRTGRRGPRGERVTTGDQNASKARQTFDAAKKTGREGLRQGKGFAKKAAVGTAKAVGKGAAKLARVAALPVALGATAAEAASVTPRQAAQRGGFPADVRAESDDPTLQRVAASDPGVLSTPTGDDIVGISPGGTQEALSAVAGIGRGVLGVPAGPEQGIAEADAATPVGRGGGLRGQELALPADERAGSGGFIEVGGKRTSFRKGKQGQQNQGLRRRDAPENTLDEAATDTERRLSDIFGQQARGGGLASAFALPNLAGNILRREAGGRISEREEREAERERAGGLAEAGLRAGPGAARNRLAQQKFAAEETRALETDLATAKEAGSDEFAQARSNVFAQAARSGPGTPSFNVAANEFGREVFEEADSTRLNEFVDEFLNGERKGFVSSLIDASVAAATSGSPEAELVPESGLFLNTNTGQLQQRRDDGTSRILVELDDLSDEGIQFFRSFGTFGQQGPGPQGRAGPLQGAQRGGLRRDPITGQ